MILYKKRRKYKYNLHSDETCETGIVPEKPADLHFLAIDAAGKLTIRKGYSWDGPSGPTIDTKTFMRGSLIHDALYQLIREKVLPFSARKRADEILKEVCLEDGMCPFRAWYVHLGVKWFGCSSAKPDMKQAP